MSEKLQFIFSGLWPNLVSTIQDKPWIILAVLAILFAVTLVVRVLYNRLNNKRANYIRDELQFWTKKENGSWEKTALSFPGKKDWKPFTATLKALCFKGVTVEVNQILHFTQSDGQWPGSGEYDASWAVTWKEKTFDYAEPARQHHRSRKPFAAIAGLLVILGLAGWYLIRPALERRAEPEQTQMACRITPEGEWVDCVNIPPGNGVGIDQDGKPIPVPVPSPTPDPERINEFSIVVDLDRPAAPGELEQLLLALADKLPAVPDIIPDWVSFGAARHPTQMAKIEGLEGFVIVFATSDGLELHRTTDELVRIGEPLFIQDYKATLIARDAHKGIGYDLSNSEWLETIDYPRGRVRVLVTQHENPALQVVSSGLVYNHRPWHLPVAIVTILLAVFGFFLWLRRR